MKKRLLTLLFFAPLLAFAQRIGKDYALFFVASKFDDGWTTLDNAPAEVKAIGDLLRDQYGFVVQTVTDATRAKIVQTLGEYKRKTYGPKDQLLVFFSMHGVHDADSDQGYLVPKDGLYNDPTYDSWFSHAALRDLAHSMKCPRILIALDACYSGIFGKGRDRPGAPAWENTPDCQAKLRAAFGEGITRKYLTAGGDTRVPAK
ncbi:MAG: caspase family protein, partial [Phycisphaerae bacterium]|nr:caspase family protein [Saprospiraceae bacterium]